MVSRKACTFFVAGVHKSLPRSVRTWVPRRSNPSSMCVTRHLLLRTREAPLRQKLFDKGSHFVFQERLGATGDDAGLSEPDHMGFRPGMPLNGLESLLWPWLSVTRFTATPLAANAWGHVVMCSTPLQPPHRMAFASSRVPYRHPCGLG
jgi:hypothetical protein